MLYVSPLKVRVTPSMQSSTAAKLDDISMSQFFFSLTTNYLYLSLASKILHCSSGVNEILERS